MPLWEIPMIELGFASAIVPELSLEELHATMAEKIKPWQRFGADYW
jgi:hypothetical protein